jgi:uncharacterized membrane protein
VGRWVVLVHVVAAFWFVGGLLGRDVTLARARRGRDVGVVAELVGQAGTFERSMARPGSIAVLAAGLLAVWARDLSFTTGWVLASLVLYLSLIPLVPLVFLPRGRIFESALADAVGRGEITDELAAAFRDRAVAWARGYEAAVVAVVVVLMVTKPF